MNKRVTAAEHLKQLEQDPSFVAAREARERERASFRQALQEEQAQLLSDLEGAGAHVESVADLIRSDVVTPAVVDILLDHLEKRYTVALRDLIARALESPLALPQWDRMESAYERESEPNVKDGLAAALAGTADANHLPAVVRLLENTSNGKSRLLLLDALRRLRSDAVNALLVRLRLDPVLQQEVDQILRKRKIVSTDIEIPRGLVEVSIGLDEEALPGFLRAVSEHVRGFGPREIAKIVKRVDNMPIDAEEHWSFLVGFDGRQVPLVVRVFLDDEDATDVYLFTEAELAATLQRVAEQFLDSR